MKQHVEENEPMNVLIPCVACAFSLTMAGTLAIAQDEDCPAVLSPLLMPPAGGTANDAPWVLSWEEAIGKSPSVWDGWRAITKRSD